MAKTPATPVVTLDMTDPLIVRLRVAKAELERLGPAPRVELDRLAILSLVTASLQALTAH